MHYQYFPSGIVGFHCLHPFLVCFCVCVCVCAHACVCVFSPLHSSRTKSQTELSKQPVTVKLPPRGGEGKSVEKYMVILRYCKRLRDALRNLMFLEGFR